MWLLLLNQFGWMGFEVIFNTPLSNLVWLEGRMSIKSLIKCLNGDFLRVIFLKKKIKIFYDKYVIWKKILKEIQILKFMRVIWLLKIKFN